MTRIEYLKGLADEDMAKEIADMMAGVAESQSGEAYDDDDRNVMVRYFTQLLLGEKRW